MTSTLKATIQSYDGPSWRVRMAVRRQLAADVRRLRALQQDVADLERHIDAERRRLAARATTETTHVEQQDTAHGLR
jgi:hypothetical protein